MGRLSKDLNMESNHGTDMVTEHTKIIIATSLEIKSELSKPYSLFNIILYCKIATKTVPQHASIHLSLYLTRSFSYTIYKAISKTCFLKASKKGKMSKPWGHKAAVNNNMVHVPNCLLHN